MSNVSKLHNTATSWDDYFMLMSHMVKTRSTCIRRAVGAVLVKHNRVVATGYNGAPSGLPHASEVGCLRNDLEIPSGEKLHICRGSHGEMNAIAHCARHGIATDGCTLYSTTKPCSMCLKVIINAGIARVVYSESYNDVMADRIISEIGNKIEFVHLKVESSEYVKMLRVFEHLANTDVE